MDFNLIPSSTLQLLCVPFTYRAFRSLPPLASLAGSAFIEFMGVDRPIPIFVGAPIRDLATGGS